jgi:hypothetical protein
MKNLKWLVLGSLVLLFSGSAQADFNVLDKTTHYSNATTGLRVDVDGNLRAVDPDRDRDFSVLLNLFNSVTLTYGATYQPNEPVYVGQYTRGALMLRWTTAAADSDSTRIGVRIWVKNSLNSGTLHLWTPNGGVTYFTNDTCYTNGRVAADSGTAVGRCIQPYSFVVYRMNEPYLGKAGAISVTVPAASSGAYVGPAIAGTGNVRIRSIPTWALRPAGVSGVMLNLSDNAGNPCPFPFIFVELINMGKCLVSNVACDFWPRVQ